MGKELDYFLDQFKKLTPLAFVDVGAMGGLPLKWNALLDVMKIIAFEPDEREFSKLSNSETVTYFNYALADISKDLTYYVTKASGKSSVLKPNTVVLGDYPNAERFQVINEIAIPAEKVRGLDQVVSENNILDVDFIKLDTQGSELSILQGGKERTLSLVFGAQIEVEFVELYASQPLFRDVDAFMNSMGFTLIDLRRHFWKRKHYHDYIGKGQLIFGDGLYFKKISVFYDELAKCKNKDYAKAKIMKAVLICLVYKVFDYAVDLLKEGVSLGYLSEDDFRDSLEHITCYASEGLPLKFRAIMARGYHILIGLLSRLCPPSYLGWADSDQRIGNIYDC